MSGAAYPASQHDSPHARMYDRDHEHPAWRELSHVAYRLISYLLAKYRPNEPNSFLAGARRLALAIGSNEKSVSSALQELIEGGHLFEERVGRNTGQRSSRERIVSLSRWDSDTRKGDPDLPKKVWRKKQ